jgi:serine/threonine-protein kinase
MDPRTWESLDQLFFAALELPRGEREAFLARACSGRPGLAAEVVALLAAHEQTRGLSIERSLLREDVPAGGTGRAGERAGPWRLVRRLGQGGMGDVWLAERADGGFHQWAAIKRVRAGWRPPDLLARFRRERQLLARLAHPNIATLLDGGTTEDGEPYLAMEYVEGESITAWCDARRLPVRERLRVFAQVCEAVRFAHANLVVHRDLKPANILVTSGGRPVLLDFGIAKLLQREDDGGEQTLAGERVLTPEYAAPEQLRGEAVTTATDVWGLGVLLYELLTGERPFRTGGAPTAEVERRVLETEPRRLSEAVRTRGRENVATGPESTAANRDTTPAALSSQLRGDLEAIVQFALRKEPERRYRSAEQLGEDIDRFLRGLPVRARPDALSYRAAKYARRHRVAVAATAGLALSLLAFGVVATVQARRIARERDRARAEEAKSTRALDVLVGLFKLSDPRTVPGGDTLRIGDVLRVAEDKIDEIEDQPEIQARLWEALADIHASRSEMRLQSGALERAIAAAHRAGAVDLELHLRCRYAPVAGRLHGVPVADSLIRATLAECERRFGHEDLRVAEALHYYGLILAPSDRARVLLERSLAIRRRLQPGDSEESARILNSLGNNWSDRAKLDRALASYDEARGMLERLVPRDHPDLLQLRHNIAMTRCAQGQFAEALRMETELLPLRRRVAGPNTTDAAGSLHGIGLALASLGRPAAAAESLREAHDILVGITGRTGTSAHVIERELTMVLARAGRAREARAMLDHLIAEAGGPPCAGAPDVWAVRMQYAGFEQAAGRPADLDGMAVALDHVRHDGDVSPRVLLDGVVELASATLAAGRASAPAAESLFLEASAIADSALAPQHPLQACIRAGLLTARAGSGRPVDRAALGASWERCRTWGGLPATLRAPVERALAAR